MRRFFSLVAFLGGAWLPCMATAQYEEPPPFDADVDVDVGVEAEAPPPPPPPAVVVEPEVEPPPPGAPAYPDEPREHKKPSYVAEIQPYFWLPLRLDGDTVLAGQRIPVHVRLKDAFENDQLSMGGGLRLEAWAWRFGLIADGAFLQLERNSDVVEFRSRQFIGDFLGGFRFLQVGPIASGPSFALAVTGGLRIVYDRERLRPVGGPAIERDDWIAKGSLGGDMPVRITPMFGLRARGQVRYPDFDWSISGLAEIDAMPVGVDIGYRYENLNYEEGGIDTDVDVHTIFVGLGFQARGPMHHRDD